MDGEGLTSGWRGLAHPLARHGVLHALRRRRAPPGQPPGASPGQGRDRGRARLAPPRLTRPLPPQPLARPAPRGSVAAKSSPVNALDYDELTEVLR